jgi:hypothetical protein
VRVLALLSHCGLGKRKSRSLDMVVCRSAKVMDGVCSRLVSTRDMGSAWVAGA